MFAVCRRYKSDHSVPCRFISNTESRLREAKKVSRVSSHLQIGGDYLLMQFCRIRRGDAVIPGTEGFPDEVAEANLAFDVVVAEYCSGAERISRLWWFVKQ